MAGTGLIALLDDIATIADDVATLTIAAARKTSGVVTDDLAVTAEQTIGLRRDRELPVVLSVAVGSFRNKALVLAPGALLLSYTLPWMIVPLLMVGGTYLAYEGVEKLLHRARGHSDHHDAHVEPMDPAEYERTRVSGAIRTDFILSAEIIALTLGTVADEPFVTQAAVLYGVSIVLTVAVYGLVALLVRLDDLGEAMVKRGASLASIGGWLVRGTPYVLHGLSWIGTVAMILVGGHIVREHIPPVEEAVHHALAELPSLAAEVAGTAVDFVTGGVVGLVAVGVVTAVGWLRRKR